MAEFSYPDFVLQVVTAARAHNKPRLYPSFIAEIERIASQMVTRREITIDNDGGPLVAATAQNPEEFVRKYAADRPHGAIPVVEIGVSDDTWTSGNLTKQGERHRALTAALGSAKAATEAMKEEALLYGTTFGSTKPGVIPSADGSKKVEKPDSDAANPFNPNRKYASQEARETDLIHFIKRYGTPAAQKGAAKYHVDIAGRPLRAKTR